MTKNKSIIALSLILIFALALILRTLFLQNLSLTFGYDQARDAFIAQQIANGDFKILGPPSSAPGLYHGVFYYYFLAIPYALSKSPIITAYWVALWNALTVFTVYALAWFMTRKQGAAILASLLFAVSWESTQYATWLSNPTIAVWTVPLIYLGLWAWINPSASSGQGKKWGPIMCGVGLGLSAQADIFLAYHLPPVVLWLWIASKNITKKSILMFTLSLVASVSTLIVSEFKFGFKGLQGVMHLATTQDAIVLSRGLGDFIVLFFNQIGKLFAYSSYPANVGLGGGLILLLVATSLISWGKKQKTSWQPFLATWLFSHITIVTVGGTSTPFLNVGTGAAVSILLGITLWQMWKTKRILFVALLAAILFGNLSKIFKENPRGSTIFAIQKDMLLSKQLGAVDYTYNEAKGEPFTINTITSPLYINIVWTYLYKWYGLPKYGYVPDWHGPEQWGQVDTLNKVNKRSETYFLIKEPLDGIPTGFVEDIEREEGYFSKVSDEKSFGSLVVQKRQVQ